MIRNNIKCIKKNCKYLPIYEVTLKIKKDIVKQYYCDKHYRKGV